MSALKFPGQAAELTLSAPVVEGQLVTTTGAVAGDAATNVAGEAMQSGNTGDTITVHRVGIRRLTAAQAITNGQPYCACASTTVNTVVIAGGIRPWVAGTDAVASLLGKAWSTAAAGALANASLTSV